MLVYDRKILALINKMSPPPAPIKRRIAHAGPTCQVLVDYGRSQFAALFTFPQLSTSMRAVDARYSRNRCRTRGAH